MSYVSGDKDSFPEHFQIKSLVMRIKTKLQPKLRSSHVPLTLCLPSSSCYLQVLGGAPTFSIRSVPAGLGQNQSTFTQHTTLAHHWEKQLFFSDGSRGLPAPTARHSSRFKSLICTTAELPPLRWVSVGAGGCSMPQKKTVLLVQLHQQGLSLA